MVIQRPLRSSLSVIKIKVVRDSEENIIDGDPDTIESLTDLWTFNRDVTSPNPNWILTRTETPTES